MADSVTSSPASSRQGKSSITGTMWAMVLGWILLRLVAGSSRSTEAVPAGRPARGGSRAGADKSGLMGKQRAPASAGEESGRGRGADAPTEIPARGWKDVL